MEARVRGVWGVTLVYRGVLNLITWGLKTEKAFSLSSQEARTIGEREERSRRLALEEGGRKLRNVLASGHVQGQAGNGFSPATSRKNAVSQHLDLAYWGLCQTSTGLRIVSLLRLRPTHP